MLYFPQMIHRFLITLISLSFSHTQYPTFIPLQNISHQLFSQDLSKQFIFILSPQMGNNTLKPSSDGQQTHERLGPVKFLQTYDNQLNYIVQTMHMQVPLVSEKILSRWEAEIRKMDDAEVREVIFLPQKYNFHKEGMCGSSGTLHIIFDNFPFTLNGEISNRHMLKKYFLEKEIWYLLYNMIRGATKFHRNNKKIGNVHPENILINDAGQIKLISTCSLPNEKNNFELACQNFQAHTFLAPQELANDAVKISEYPSDVDPCVAEVFSIGLTVLAAGTLNDCSDVYKRQNQTIKIDKQSVRDIFESLKLRYSPFLSDVLGEMLELSPQRRKCSYDIYSMLYTHENEIMDLELFPLPEKYSQPQTVHKTGSEVHNKITFINGTPQIMDPYMKPQVSLGSQKKIIQQQPVIHSDVKIRSQPFIAIKATNKVQFTNFMPQNPTFSINPQIPIQKHFVSPLKLPSTHNSMSYLRANLSPRVRFQKPMNIQEIRQQEIRHVPQVVKKVFSPIQALRKQASNMQSTVHMRYSKNPSSNMLSTGHIYVHPPGGNDRRKVLERQNVVFSLDKDETRSFEAQQFSLLQVSFRDKNILKSLIFQFDYVQSMGIERERYKCSYRLKVSNPQEKQQKQHIRKDTSEFKNREERN